MRTAVIVVSGKKEETILPSAVINTASSGRRMWKDGTTRSDSPSVVLQGRLSLFINPANDIEKAGGQPEEKGVQLYSAK